MARLTKRKALQVCYELWIWLSENPDKEKTDWPGWEKYEQWKYGEMTSNCSCCEYVYQRPTSTDWIDDNSDCLICPLLEYWNIPEDYNIYDSDEVAPCECDDSPYQKWKKYEFPRTRSKHALTIANAAKAELDKLPPLKKKGQP